MVQVMRSRLDLAQLSAGVARRLCQQPLRIFIRTREQRLKVVTSTRKIRADQLVLEFRQGFVERHCVFVACHGPTLLNLRDTYILQPPCYRNRRDAPVATIVPKSAAPATRRKPAPPKKSATVSFSTVLDNTPTAIANAAVSSEMSDATRRAIEIVRASTSVRPSTVAMPTIPRSPQERPAN